ncbi:hypothetical protein QMU85_003524 [Photobacterium damselae]|nr:hypothetical protein [Photobacterium damselae]
MVNKAKIVKLSSLFPISKQPEIEPEIEFTPAFFTMVDFMMTHTSQAFTAKYYHWVNTTPDDFILTDVTSHREKVSLIKAAAILKSEGLPVEQLKI